MNTRHLLPSLLVAAGGIWTIFEDDHLKKHTRRLRNLKIGSWCFFQKLQSRACLCAFFCFFGFGMVKTLALDLIVFATRRQGPVALVNSWQRSWIPNKKHPKTPDHNRNPKDPPNTKQHSSPVLRKIRIHQPPPFKNRTPLQPSFGFSKPHQRHR